MKKKITFIVSFIMACTFVFSQTIVGTDPENKNVVLEEFTGIHCVFCPDGHAIAQAIYNAHPDDVILINIHQGSYAVPSGSEPDFRTPWGNAIAGQSGLVGYPAGTVNRHLFSGWSQGSGTAMSRNYWTSASNQVMAAPSYLNVGIESIIVTSTRQLVVEVEVYYTDNSPFPTNFLNVAILQNNVLGPQTGGNMGNNYVHKHMLRHLLTGQWGVEIDETTTGSLYSGTFTYEIPEDYTGVGVVLENLDIVAFVTENHQEAISGIMGSITTIESNDYDAAILSAYYPQTACDGSMAPIVEIKNYGVNNLTSLDFNYEINGGETATYTWTGNLTQNETTKVTLPEITFDVTTENTLSISCANPAGHTDELPQNDQYNTTFEQSQYYPKTGYFGVQTLGDPQDITWSIVDESGSAIAEGGPYSTMGLHLEPFTFPTDGCYTLTLHDDSGNGLSDGFYIITDDATNVLWTGPAFTDMSIAGLMYDSQVGLDENMDAGDIGIYPNPLVNQANISFNLNSASKADIAVFDLLGKQVAQVYAGTLNAGHQNIKLDAESFEKGVYFVKINLNNQTFTKKIVISQ